MNQPFIFGGELLVSGSALVGHDSDRGIIFAKKMLSAEP